ncbi:MAG: NAD(+) synthase [Candidatus Eisenbacteria bacterium]
MDWTASDPTGAWSRWRARTADLRPKVAALLTRELAQRGQTRAVIGLSGGLDSTVAAWLCVETLGAANVLGVLLPYRTSDPLSLSSAQGIVNTLGITSRRVNISPMVDAYFANFPDASRERRAARLAWERLSILHDFGAHYGGLVLQLVNRTDLALDYGPEPRLPGLAFRPFEGLFKAEIRLLGRELKIPAGVLDRRPSLDAYPGQSDESELGAGYDVIDPVLEWLVDQKGEAARAVSLGLPPEVVARLQARLERRREYALPAALS